MSLTSNATNDNDTYINLILNTACLGDCSPKSVSETPVHIKMDITEQIFNELDGFAPDCIDGFEYQVNGLYGGTNAFFTQNDIIRLSDDIKHILDACIVNEKQKRAISDLITKEVSNLVGKKQRELFH